VGLDKQVTGVSTDKLSHDRQTDLEHKILSILKTDGRSNTWEDTPRSIRNSFIESKILRNAESDIPHEVYRIPTHKILHVGTHFI
jgi:hypothetical protein